MLERQDGFTLLETLFVLAIVATLAAIAIPQFAQALDDFRTRAAVRHLAVQLARARIEAIKRSTMTALYFSSSGGADYGYTLVADGNDNGVRSADISAGTDPALTSSDVLGWHYHGVRFGLGTGVPDADNVASTSADGVRVGVSRILSMNPNGSSSSGTLYVMGERGSQYAVRTLGATARVRILKYDRGRNRWIEP